MYYKNDLIYIENDSDIDYLIDKKFYQWRRTQICPKQTVLRNWFMGWKEWNAFDLYVCNNQHDDNYNSSPTVGIPVTRGELLSHWDFSNVTEIDGFIEYSDIFDLEILAKWNWSNIHTIRNCMVYVGNHTVQNISDFKITLPNCKVVDKFLCNISSEISQKIQLPNLERSRNLFRMDELSLDEQQIHLPYAVQVGINEQY